MLFTNQTQKAVLYEGNTVGGGSVFVLYFCWFCHGQWKVCRLFFKNLFIFNWRIIALQYGIGLYQTSIWVSHSVASFISVCPLLSEGKRWRNWFLCLGAQSSTSAVMVILYCKPPAAGERTKTPEDPSGPQWPRLSTADLPHRPAAAPAGPPDRGAPLCIHSFPWVCPFWPEKTIWILFKRYLFQKRKMRHSGLAD